MCADAAKWIEQSVTITSVSKTDREREQRVSYVSRCDTASMCAEACLWTRQSVRRDQCHAVRQSVRRDQRHSVRQSFCETVSLSDEKAQCKSYILQSCVPRPIFGPWAVSSWTYSYVIDVGQCDGRTALSPSSTTYKALAALPSKHKRMLRRTRRSFRP